MSQAAPPAEGTQAAADVEKLSPFQKLAAGFANLTGLEATPKGTNPDTSSDGPFRIPEHVDRAELLKTDEKLARAAAGTIGQRLQAENSRLAAELNSIKEQQKQEAEERERKARRDLLETDPFEASSRELARMDEEEAEKQRLSEMTAAERQAEEIRRAADRPLHAMLDRLSAEERSKIQGKEFLPTDATQQDLVAALEQHGEDSPEYQRVFLKAGAESRDAYVAEVTEALARDAQRAKPKATVTPEAAAAATRSQRANDRRERGTPLYDGGGGSVGVNPEQLTPSQKIAAGLSKQPR